MGSPIPAMGSPIPATCSPSSAKWWSEGGIPHLCSARWEGTPRTPGGRWDGTPGHRGGEGRGVPAGGGAGGGADHGYIRSAEAATARTLSGWDGGRSRQGGGTRG